MESKTKIDLSETLISALLRQHFGSNSDLAASLPLKDGWFNSAYHLTLKDGSTMVLKVAPPPHIPILTYEQDIMRAEVEVMQRLSAQKSVPLPKFLAVDFSRTFLPCDYYFMELLHGISLDHLGKNLSEADREAIEFQKGQIAAHFHLLKNDTFGYPMMRGEAYTHTWREAFLQIIANILADRARFNVRLPRKADTIYRLFEENAHLLEAVNEAVLLHFDFWDGNIFVKGQPGAYEIERFESVSKNLRKHHQSILNILIP